MLRLALAALLSGACSAPARPIANMHPTPHVPRLAGPTMATAGAQTCRLGEAVTLGPHGAGNAVLAFGLGGGLVAWKPSDTALALQPLASDGALRSGARQIAVASGVEPHAIHALGDRFLVLLRKWDWQHHEVDWWGLVADRVVHLGLADLDIDQMIVVDDRRLALHVGPAAISKQSHAPRWQMIALDGDTLTSTVGIAATDPTPAAEIAFAVANHAVPPPPGPGGRIFEALGDPVLERTRRGQAVGEPLHLEYDGNRIAHGMNISAYIVWSGSHFIYPFWRGDGRGTYVWRLLPIDCRP